MSAGVGSEGAVAAERHGCHLRGATVVKSTSEAVVFRRKDPRVWGGVLYGCYRRKGAIYRLNFGNLDGVPEPVKLRALAGRYAGYVAFDEGVTGSDTLTIVVVRDLVTGVVVRQAQNGESGFAAEVLSFVLNRRGLAAWITKDHADATASRPWEFQVLALDRRGDPRVVDRGQDIEPRSLILSRDGRTLSWRKAGARRTAALG